MQLHEPLYEDVITDNTVSENVTARVRRRPFGSNLRNRISQIVSMYVPSTSPDNPREGDSGDHTGLLAGQESKVEYITDKADELYDIRLLYSGENLIKHIMNGIGTSSSLFTGNKRITSIAADDHTVYLGFEDLPYVFLLNGLDDESDRSDPSRTPVKGYIQLHVPGIGDLVPQELCVYSANEETSILYVVGWIRPPDAKNQTKRWVLSKFALNGQHLSRTRIYGYQRYGGLSVDSVDGKLLLACPTLCESPNESLATGESEFAAGQLCKLTSGFERRVFSVTMGGDFAIYRPDFVAQECAGHCCWASVQRFERVNRKDDKKQTGVQKPKIARRLFAFPGRQLNGEERKSPREWIHVVSWDFADLNPGRIAAYDANRLLVIDSDKGTLSYITWADGVDKPSLHRITRPKSKPIDLICTTYQVTSEEDASPYPIAYFVSGSNVFTLSFREDFVPN